MKMPLLYKKVEDGKLEEIINITVTVTKNITKEGLSFYTNEPIALTTLLALQVNCGIFSPVHAIGRVIKSEKNKEQDRYRIEVEFTKIKPRDKKQLAEFIKNSLRKEQAKEHIKEAELTVTIGQELIPFEALVTRELVSFFDLVFSEDGAKIRLTKQNGNELIRATKRVGLRFVRS